MSENACNFNDLERLRRDIEAFVQEGAADAAFDSYAASQQDALAVLEAAESLDPAKFRTPITL